MTLANGAASRAGLETPPLGPGPAALDETNKRILQLLARQGRSTMRDIADAVGRSESTVRERVANLELRGVVMGYEARIDWALAGLPVLLLVDGDCPPDLCTQVAVRLHKIPNVVHAVATTGSPNVLVLVRVRDIQDVKGLRLRLASTGLANIEARIALEPLVNERQPMQLSRNGARGVPLQALGPLPPRPLPDAVLSVNRETRAAGLVHANS